MRRALLALSGGIVAATGVAIAWAAEADSPDAVVVSATRIATPELQLASSLTVITGDEIEAFQQRSLPEVLQYVPGLNVVRTGGPGGQTTVFLRGTNANHTKVLIDGIDVSDPSSTAGSFDFSQLLTADIERIEVLRGPQSGLYGSDAIGGVINIITRAGAGPAQLTALAEGGSFDTFNQSASLRGSDERFHYSGTIEHFHSGATPVTPLNLLIPGEKRNDDYYDNLSEAMKLSYEAANAVEWGLVARHTDGHLRVTGDDFSSFPSFPAAQQSKTLTSESYARATAHWISPEGFLDQTLGIAYTRKRSSERDPGGPEVLDAGARTKVDWQGALKLSQSQTLVLGAEHARDSLSEPRSAGNVIDSGYAELQSQFITGLFTALNARYDANDRYGGKATYRFAPAYVLSGSGTKLKASVGTGFKAPTLNELYVDYLPYFFANPNLRPETSTGYDVGVEQPLAARAARVGVTYFHNRIRNLIVSDESFTSYANIGRASTRGIESFAAYQPTKQLSLRADYTYTQATDDVLHEELLRRPKHKATLTAAWQPSDVLSVDAAILTISSWLDGNRDFSISPLRAPGYTVVNLALNYSLGAHFALFGRVDNLLDRHYQNPTGFLQPGIGVFAGIRSRL